MSKVVSFVNYKGGAGKTTTTALVSLTLAKKGYKVASLDLDPQANLTSLLAKTGGYAKDGVINIKQTLMESINDNKPLISGAMPIVEHENGGSLDLIPSTADFMNFEGWLYEMAMLHKEDPIKFGAPYLKPLVDKLREHYDFIFLDVPPALSLANLSAFYACDYLTIVLKTTEFSFDGSNTLIEYLKKTFVDKELDSDMDVLGIIPVIEENNSYLDKRVVENARKQFGDQVFKHVIQKMKRVERYSVTGVTDDGKDQWDRKVDKQFEDVTDEFLKMIKDNENELANQ